MTKEKPETSCPQTPASLAPEPASRSLLSRGFTLVELLMVMVIIAILAILTMPSFIAIKEKARVMRTVSELRDLEKLIVAYALDKGAFPANLADIGQAGRNDPWGQPYRYGPPVRELMVLINEDFDLYSAGLNGLSEDDISAEASLDDIVRSGGSNGDIGFVGLASELVP